MIRHEPGHLRHPLGAFHHVPEVDCFFKNLVEFRDIAYTLHLRKVEEFLFECSPVNEQVVGGERVMERDSGAVADGLCNAVPIKITVRWIVAPERDERSLPVRTLVNGGAGEPDVGSIRECTHEIVAQRAGGCTVGFVHKDEDCVPGIDLLRHTFELVDHRDDEATVIGCKEFLQFPFALRDFDISNPGSGEIAEELGFEFVPVHEHDHGRALKDRFAEDLLCCHDHRVGLARPLCVPDQAAFLSGIPCAAERLIDSPHLVLAEHDFL